MKSGRRSRASGTAEAQRYPYPASFYMDAYRSYQITAAAVRSGPHMKAGERESARVRLFEQRSRAKWALASHGVGSLPYALEMLFSGDPEEHEDGGMILGLIGSGDDSVDQIASFMQTSEDPRVRIALISLLGEKRNVRAVPHLTAIFVDPSADADTKKAATNALALLAPFGVERSGEPEVDVRVEMGAWIAEHLPGSELDEQKAV